MPVSVSETVASDERTVRFDTDDALSATVVDSPLRVSRVRAVREQTPGRELLDSIRSPSHEQTTVLDYLDNEATLSAASGEDDGDGDDDDANESELTDGIDLGSEDTWSLDSTTRLDDQDDAEDVDDTGSCDSFVVADEDGCEYDDDPEYQLSSETTDSDDDADDEEADELSDVPSDRDDDHDADDQQRENTASIDRPVECDETHDDDSLEPLAKRVARLPGCETIESSSPKVESNSSTGC